MKRTLLVALAFALGLTTTPTLAESKIEGPPGPGFNNLVGGPDGFGYVFADTAEATCSFQFVDITATGTPTVSGDDVCGAAALSAPFNFYGTAYNTVQMCSNGFLSLNDATAAGDLSNDCPLPSAPSTGGGARAYAVHDDLITNNGLSQYFAACPRDSNTGPEDCTVFQFDEATHFGATTPFDFEVILYHQSGEVAYMWDDRNPEMGSASTTGIQDENAVNGLTYVCNTGGSLPNNSGVCFFLPNFGDADLTITMTATEPRLPGEEANLGPGNTILYNLAVTNNGPDTATNTVVTDPLPAEVNYNSDTCGGANGPPWTWPIGDLANGATINCEINTSANQLCLEGVLISNTATVTADQDDANTADNAATADLLCGVVGPPTIPTLGEIGLLALLLALAGVGIFVLRRR